MDQNEDLTARREAFGSLFRGAQPVLSLAPMQDITDWPFWNLMARHGGADLYFTEFFRVTPDYVPEKSILRSIVENPTGRPAVAQIIGNDLEAMARVAQARYDGAHALSVRSSATGRLYRFTHPGAVETIDAADIALMRRIDSVTVL